MKKLVFLILLVYLGKFARIHNAFSKFSFYLFLLNLYVLVFDDNIKLVKSELYSSEEDDNEILKVSPSVSYLKT